MVVLNKIYTRSGDGGDTALSDGSRRPKHDARVEAYGTVDELNATIGMARQHASGVLAARMAAIQNDLFDLGADLSRPGRDKDAEAPHPVLRIVETQVLRLEQEIDVMNETLAPLRSFVLPGGTGLSAHLHLSRTVARRAERRATELATVEDVNPEAIRYLNRVSDWMFVAARQANDGGADDILWTPGAHRG